MCYGVSVCEGAQRYRKEEEEANHLSLEAIVICTVRHIVRHGPTYIVLFHIDAMAGLQVCNSIWGTSDIQRMDCEFLTLV